MICSAAGVLKELARDLSSSLNVDKERAVSMLSSLTPYVEHHQTMLQAGVLPCLMQAVEDDQIVPQVASCLLATLQSHGVSCKETTLVLGRTGPLPLHQLQTSVNKCRLAQLDRC